MQGEAEVQLHIILTSALYGSESSASRSDCFTSAPSHFPTTLYFHLASDLCPANLITFDWISQIFINPLNPELNPICYLLELLAHHSLHVSRIMVKSLTLRLLMSYIYGAHILDDSRSHTTTQHSRQDSSGRVISSSQRPLPDNTRHSQQTNIHAPSGIRTHDLDVCCQVEVSATS